MVARRWGTDPGREGVRTSRRVATEGRTRHPPPAPLRLHPHGILHVFTTSRLAHADTFLNQPVQFRAHRLQRHLRHHLRRKRVREEPPRRRMRDAPALQVEQHVLVRAHPPWRRGCTSRRRRRSRAAAWCRSCAVSESSSVAVGLLRVGLLRLGRHEDLPVEHAVRPAVQDALVDLPAAAVRDGRGRSPCGCPPAARPGRSRGRTAGSPRWRRSAWLRRSCRAIAPPIAKLKLR